MGGQRSLSPQQSRVATTVGVANVHMLRQLTTIKELRSEKECIPVVNVVDDNTVAITNIKVSVSGAGDSRERVRHYHADHTFDSSCSPHHPSYASQEKVFETIGREVVASVSRGCSACVLAYGQSATGKTHTMMGAETQPGLIPRLCKALFDLPSVELTVSFLEIYNERVHDLLVGEAFLPCHSLPRRRGNARKDLRVREHPTKGPYVQNLRRVSVSDVEALLALVGEGARRRQTAATRRNSTSSRSHALIEIATPHATLHLADLAGSEKASWEGCGGGRQKEGANINKSLVALSNVISALVSGGPGRGRFVPYRDSALTWLLKDCFTGGARAFIIATVSPSAACYGESASTLRWAARARQLPSPRTAPCGSNTSSRAALQAQLNQLIAELIKNHIRYIPETGTISYEEKHWTLHSSNQIVRKGELETITIGNIMNQSSPKLDANNSESTASSVASGSSDVINMVEKPFKITNEINKEIDKLFGPALERTSSGVDLKVVAPLRHKRRQCRSQEVLTIDETVNSKNRSLANMLPSHSGMQINDNDVQTVQKISPPVTILHENQRAEIVASVTERLYTRLKKKEESAVSKVESMVDKKIVEPLSELKICTNARQRLMELSKKAIRNKRRIGIPAYTQTRPMVTRVKDQATDVQTDLLSYIIQHQHLYKMHRDVATETIPITPRCKEISAGPTSSIDFEDRSTETKRIEHKHSIMMTEINSSFDRCTQTPIVPPPRRKKRLMNQNCDEHISDISSSIPVISINISQTYPIDCDSQSSDDNLENLALTSKSSVVTTTPDLLTNHNNMESQMKQYQTKDEARRDIDVNTSQHNTESNDEIEFSDTDDQILPRVTIDTSKKCNNSEIKNIIMGRNENIYPYNIVLSPPRLRDNSKRIVKFKDINVEPALSVASQTSWVWEHNDNGEVKSNLDSDIAEKASYSSKSHEGYSDDSTLSSKIATDSFVWKGSSKTLSSRKNIVPVYKSKKYKTLKPTPNKKSQENIEREFDDSTLHIDTDTVEERSSSDSLSYNIAQPQLRRRKSNPADVNYFHEDHKTDDISYFHTLERKVYDSCNKVEDTVTNYENYLASYGNNASTETTGWRPQDYLQHLVQLRREAIRAENDFVLTDNSSIDTFN